MRPRSHRPARWTDILSRSQRRLFPLKERPCWALMPMAQTQGAQSIQWLYLGGGLQTDMAHMACKATSAPSPSPRYLRRRAPGQVLRAARLAWLPMHCQRPPTPPHPLSRRLMLRPCNCVHLLRHLQWSLVCPLGMPQGAGRAIGLSIQEECPGKEDSMHIRLSARSQSRKHPQTHGMRQRIGLQPEKASRQLAT